MNIQKINGEYKIWDAGHPGMRYRVEISSPDYIAYFHTIECAKEFGAKVATERDAPCVPKIIDTQTDDMFFFHGGQWH